MGKRGTKPKKVKGENGFISPQSYTPKSMIWGLANEDFSDLTIEQIAEVFDCCESTVRSVISTIKKETGIEVKYKRREGNGKGKKKA